MNKVFLESGTVTVQLPSKYLKMIMLYKPEYEVEIKLINEEIKDQEQTLGRIKRRNVATDMSPRCPF